MQLAWQARVAKSINHQLDMTLDGEGGEELPPPP